MRPATAAPTRAAMASKNRALGQPATETFFLRCPPAEGRAASRSVIEITMLERLAGSPPPLLPGPVVRHGPRNQPVRAMRVQVMRGWRGRQRILAGHDGSSIPAPWQEPKHKEARKRQGRHHQGAKGGFAYGPGPAVRSARSW